jgi:hypothetical protein
MSSYTTEELEQLSKDVIAFNTPDKATPAHECAGYEAWEFSRKLESELKELRDQGKPEPFLELF